jgi:hypothetical protein
MKKLIAILSFIGWTLNVHADLSATVYPGYTFAPGDRPTVAQLNALGRPTVYVSGTIGGTNSGLAADSITGTMLDSSTYDNVTIDKTNGALRVKQSGIRNYQIYTNIFDTSSAIDPGGTTIRWNPDWNFLAISNNQATIRTSIVTTAVSAGLRSSTFTYSNQTSVPSAANAQSVNHGMGTTPSWWRVTMVCTNADLNYSAGDEVDLSAFSVFGVGFSGNSVFSPAFVTYIDSGGTPAIVARRCASSISSVAVTMYGLNKTTGDYEAITTASWNLRFRVRP